MYQEKSGNPALVGRTPQTLVSLKLQLSNFEMGTPHPSQRGPTLKNDLGFPTSLQSYFHLFSSSNSQICYLLFTYIVHVKNSIYFALHNM
jgi:hypothetical protein